MENQTRARFSWTLARCRGDRRVSSCPLSTGYHGPRCRAKGKMYQ